MGNVESVGHSHLFRFRWRLAGCGYRMLLEPKGLDSLLSFPDYINHPNLCQDKGKSLERCVGNIRTLSAVCTSDPNERQQPFIARGPRRRQRRPESGVALGTPEPQQNCEEFPPIQIQICKCSVVLRPDAYSRLTFQKRRELLTGSHHRHLEIKICRLRANSAAQLDVALIYVH